MTTPAINRLLISHITLRGPEIAHLYRHIVAHPGTSYDELVSHLVPVGATDGDDFGIAEAPLRETLNFLLVARLVEQHGTSRFKASFTATPLLQHTPFPLLLLHHIRMHPDKRQQAPVLIYHQLVTADVLATTAPTLRDQMERGDYHSLFAWTSEKIGFWLHLFTTLGVIRRLERSSEVLIVPHTTFVLDALAWVHQRHPAMSSLADYLDILDTTFFACFTARGRVHCGVAQTLLALHSLGRIHMTHHADAARSVILGERRVSDVVIAAT